jgi:hypothetical protein
LTASTFRAAAGFSFFIQLAQPIDIIRCGHEVKFLGRERKVVQSASAGIITKAPALSNDEPKTTSESCAPRPLALLFSQASERRTFPRAPKSCSNQKITGLRAKNLCQTKAAN